jgi:Kef-type K+ transport system membrane component KefB
MATTLLALAIVVLAARIVGELAVRFSQPRVVGEILAGIVIGPSVLGLIGGPLATDRLFPEATRDALGVIGQIGLLLFMLIVGAAFDPSKVARRWRAVSIVALAVVAVPVIAGFALGPLLHGEVFAVSGSSTTAFALYLGAMMSVSAFPVTVRILEERGLDRSSFGVVAIASAAVVTVLMFVVTAWANVIAADGDLLDLVEVGIRATAYVTVMLVLVRPVLARVGSGITSRSPTEVLTVAISLALISGWLATEAGLGVIVGGFLAGVALPRREVVAPILESRLSDLVGSVLLPVFLATSGLITDLTALELAAMIGLVGLLITAIATKLVVGWGVARCVGLADPEARALGALMNCRGLLVLIVGMAAYEAEVITAQMQVGSVLVALVTTAMTGPLVRRSLTPAPT